MRRLHSRIAALEAQTGLDACTSWDPEAARESARRKLADFLARAAPLQATDPTAQAVAMREFREALQERIARGDGHGA